MKNQALQQLYIRQLQEFELARQNYEGLKQVQVREIPWEHFHLRIQYNPARMISTNAKTDRQSLESRPCFLCASHMPTAQKGLPYLDRYHLFVNPYPIFERHFTIPSDRHLPQRLEGRLKDFLALSFDFPEFTLFYNGPRCGASAPDHFHFQMAPRHHMPLEEDVENDSIRHPLLRDDYYSIFTLTDYLRPVIVLRASDALILTELFRQTQQIIGQTIPFEEEPMINLLGWFDNCQWTVCIFPRRTLRPWQFHADGAEKVLFSPGCVDMAGLIIAPREEDFYKYSTELLTDLFAQVSIAPTDWDIIQQRLKHLVPFQPLPEATEPHD